MTIRPEEQTPQNIYKLLIGAVVPRPIAFVSTLSKHGVPNLAPFSFFTVASANPPVVCFSNSVRNNGTQKDTLHNVRDTGEFVVNIVGEEIAEPMNVASGDYPPDSNEFAISGLTPLASELVKPFRVAESLIHMECRLVQIVSLGEGPNGGSLVLGEVVRFHVDDSIIDNFRIDHDKLKPIGRMAGASYTRCQDRFDMARPVIK